MRGVQVFLDDVVYFDQMMYPPVVAGRLTVGEGNYFNGAPYRDFKGGRTLSEGTGVPNNTQELYALGSRHVYTGSTGVAATIDRWNCSTAGYSVNQGWAATTAYAKGKRIFVNTTVVLVATVGGVSGTVAPTGAGVDGTVTWAVLGVKSVFTTVNN
ncbi:hypothetical protein D3C71_1425470 [compost metagenome]